MNLVVNILLWICYFISFYYVVFWLLVFLEPEPRYKKRKLKRFPFVSIVVPAYNEERVIKRTLRNLINLDYPKEKYEIIVVNDGSKDRTEIKVREFIKKHKGYNIELINQENKGKGAALNHGLKKAKGKFFVCLDADSFIKKDALKKILPYFTNKNVAAVLPSLKVYKPKKFIEKIQWVEYIINMFYKRLMSHLNVVHITPGPFAVYRKDILIKLGGFDENNLTEDLEIAVRMQKHNYKIIQLLETEALTIPPQNVKGLYRQRNRWFKGTLLNVLKYKNLLFNKKYGDFGLIQMPTIALGGFLAITLFVTFVYYTIKAFIINIKKLFLVNFDFVTFLKSFSFNFYFLDINFIQLFIGIVMFLATLYVIIKAHKVNKEKLTKYGVSSLIGFTILLFFFLGFVWLSVVTQLIFRKKQKW